MNGSNVVPVSHAIVPVLTQMHQQTLRADNLNEYSHNNNVTEPIVTKTGIQVG